MDLAFLGFPQEDMSHGKVAWDKVRNNKRLPIWVAMGKSLPLCVFGFLTCK